MSRPAVLFFLLLFSASNQLEAFVFRKGKATFSKAIKASRSHNYASVRVPIKSHVVSTALKRQRGMQSTLHSNSDGGDDFSPSKLYPRALFMTLRAHFEYEWMMNV